MDHGGPPGGGTPPGGTPSGGTLTGGGEPPTAAEIVHNEAVMGTVATFAVNPGRLAHAAVEEGVRAACASLHEADALFSTWKPDSPMSRLRRGELVPDAVPATLPVVLELCTRAKELTAGWFDPWALPGGVDPTGLVKGWAVERAAALLEAAGPAGAMVNAGGDLVVLGDPAVRPAGPDTWHIGIRHPWRPAALACVLEIRSPGAVATSGTYERGEHLIDPRTGEAASRLASATVTGPSLALADAFATALAVGGDAALEETAWPPGYSAYLIRPDGSERRTDGIVVVS